MLRAGDERALLPALCRVIVEEGGYSGAWVSDMQSIADPKWHVLACAGITPQIATSMALPVVRQAMQVAVPGPMSGTDGPPDQGGLLFDAGEGSTPRQAPGCEGMAQKSFALRSRTGGLLGHFGIVLEQPAVFDDGEAEIFNELATDLAWVIEKLRAGESHSCAEQQLLRADRALRTLSAGNRTLLRANDEKQLLHEMCRVVVQQGGYAAAGVAYVEHNEQSSLRPMAWVGIPAEFFQKYVFTWADTEPGHLALGIAVRTGQPAVAKDILRDPAYGYIHDDLARMSFASNSALPLRVDGEVIGCLSIAAAEPDAFAEDELRLLGEMADDLSFGISTLRLRVKHHAAEQALQRMAYFDPLTGLPNRTLLHEQFAVAVSESRQRRRPLALLLVKVGQFQEINDTLGYRKGDALLRDVSLRLRQFLNNNEPLARTGEDEFAVLLPGTGAEQATRVAQQLVTTLYSPIELDGLDVDARIYIGIALFPGHGTDPDALIRRANVAAQLGKGNAFGYAVYAGSADPECSSRLALMADLRRAIAHDELLLYCQPKVHMVSRGVCGAEALVRWQHPRHGLIPTGDFIRLAENSGLITPLTHWVLEAAFRQIYDWSDAGIDCPLSVNLSAHDLRNPRLLDHVRGLFSTWGIGSQAIQFEITESALMEDPAGALETLAHLHGLGVEIYIDDFGTGYSSLSYLQKLPVDSIKIDQSFVKSMVGSKDSAVIVRSTIDLGHNLNRSVVAEGVESQALWEELLELGCDVAQGYFISEPMPVERFGEWQLHSSWMNCNNSRSSAS